MRGCADKSDFSTQPRKCFASLALCVAWAEHITGYSIQQHKKESVNTSEKMLTLLKSNQNNYTQYFLLFRIIS